MRKDKPKYEYIWEVIDPLCEKAPLEERTRKMVTEWLGTEKSLNDLEEDFGLSPERIRQIIWKGGRKLVHGLEPLKKVSQLEEKLEETNKALSYYKRIAENGVEQNISPIEDEKIEALGLSTRVYICLKRCDVDYVREIKRFSKRELLEIRNFGKKSLEDLQQSLDEVGLSHYLEER